MRSYIAKIALLILVIMSLPLYKKLTLPVMAGILVIIGLIIGSILIDKKMKKSLQNDAASAFLLEISRPWMQLLLTAAVIMIFLEMLIRSGVPSSKWVVIILCWTFPLIGLYVVIKNVLTIISTARNFSGVSRKKSEIAYYLILTVALLLALIGPYFVFAYGYDLFFKVILDKDIGSKFEAFYLSLILSNVMPANNPDYVELISDVNKNTLLTYFHVFQIFFTRIIEGVLLVAIFNALNGALKFAKA